MRVLVLALAVSACNSYYSPLPDGGCTNQHAACTTSNGTAGDFDAGCPAGEGCFPDKAGSCTTGSCAGFCVKAATGTWSGRCEACGSCEFFTGGFAGFGAPEGCRERASVSPRSGCADCGSTCDLD